MNVEVIAESPFFAALLFLAALLVYAITVKRLTVFSFVLLGLTLLEVIHLGIEHYFWYIYTSYADYSIIYFLWYAGFAATDILFVYFLVRISRTLKVPLDWVSSFVMYVYLILGIVQVARYFDRFIFETNYLVTMYTDGIPIVNMVLSTVVFGFVIFEVIRNAIRILNIRQTRVG